MSTSQPRPEPSTIVVVGSCIIDITVATPTLPDRGECLVATGVTTQVGGKASNQAIAVQRLGGQASLITKLGADEWADVALRLWQREGIETRHVAYDSGATTGMGLVLVDAGGENMTLSYPGASAQLVPADLDAVRATIREVRVLSLHLNAPLTTIEHALEMAKAHGVTTILNVSPPEHLPSALYHFVDVCIVNRAEAAWLTGQPIVTASDAMAAGAQLVARGAGAAIVSLGADGLTLATPMIQRIVPGIAVAAVDTTGAGDALNAGIAVALAEGRDLLAAAHFGVAVSALAVTKPGTWAAMPIRAEVEALLRSTVRPTILTSPAPPESV